jgi:hypothetical protein
MKHVICTIALAVSAISGAQAAVPHGPDAFNGAFVRMLGHEATSARDSSIVTNDSDRRFETWVNGAARNEVSSLEAGFARMLARADQVLTRSIVYGKPDPVAAKIAEALGSQRVDERLALRD